jgi:hypothetical protein
MNNRKKQCRRCKEYKDLGEFKKRRDSKDGRGAQCKMCDAQYRQANKDKIKERQTKTK